MPPDSLDLIDDGKRVGILGEGVGWRDAVFHIVEKRGDFVGVGVLDDVGVVAAVLHHGVVEPHRL